MTTTTCEEARRLAHRAIDGEADASEVAALEAHCLDCAACAAERAELAAVGPLLRSALARPAAPALRLRFSRRLAAEQARERYWDETGRIARRWSRVAAVVAIALGLAAGIAIVRGGASAEPATSEVDQIALVPARAAAEDILLQHGPVTADDAADLLEGSR
jgi:anti-sigma factor RsiW